MSVGAAPGEQERLPCGTDHEELVAQVVDGAPARDPAHQGACPHCRAVLAQLRQAWAPVLQLQREHVRAPAQLLADVVARVRALPRSTWYAVLPTEDGETRISARVVGAVARLAAQEVPSVSLALGRGRAAAGGTDGAAGADGAEATHVGVAGSSVVVDVRVVVTMGTHLPSAAQRVREVVTRRLAQVTGLSASAVDVTVVDVALDGLGEVRADDAGEPRSGPAG
ncbi:Asp23/Gls24 family envelope stress response protein [Quadrisphaera sp. DSM 44207]|uniref:Asp23/Gls24 family envelope stress response protein n=1 Tax=Quadrisphaera sp. DSM 44207 TaxID=1881057 RepID=UPI0008887C15|nr:Asp23/Gls24 family envelope stress response protein [Quadrisphaera sp. DSM 44207]SDQ85729.1 Uncharacterized conserved protein YloU, alkaline shock protein (Asp23) family [Quadrisphaera sp. DSM 44207]